MKLEPGSKSYRSSHIRALRLILICLLVVELADGCVAPPKDRKTIPPETKKPQKRTVNNNLHWFKNTFIRPTAEAFYVRRWWGRLVGHPIEAKNIDADGNPIDSVVFVNRDVTKMSPSDIARGPNSDDGPVGQITLKKMKATGASPGFFGEDSRGIKYIFKFDIPDWPEMATGAEIVGNRLMYALGYNVPEALVVTMNGTGTNFDGRRCAAIKFVPGEILGPWPFKENRDLREVRALKIASAWINNTDIKEPNSLMTWQNGKLVVYLIDFGNSLGSHTIGPKSPKSGWEYTADVEELWRQILTLGLCGKPYARDKAPSSKAVGLFDADFDPEKWKSNYPFFPFRDVTLADAKWMAKKIAAFSDEQIRAAVSAGKYTRKEDADYIAGVLIKRRDVIRDCYLK